MGAVRLKVDLMRPLFSDKRLSWERIEEFRCKAMRMMTARGGVPLARTLSRNLVIEGSSQQLSIIEPSKAQKQRIIRELRECAPEKWHSLIEEVGKEWGPYTAW